MSGPQLDPLTIVMPGAGVAPVAPTAEPRLAPPAAPLNEASQEEPLSGGRAKLDGRLVAAMRGAAEALGFDGAELWLLDDATVRLHRRVGWSADGAASFADARVLAESAADLAVLAGQAVVLESADESEELGLHRPAGSAIGVPASSDLTIHGVLWLFGNPGLVADAAVELTEIVAARLAVELEREVLLSERPGPAEVLAERESTSLGAELPTHHLTHDQLDAAGWIDAHAGVAFHDWAELADGRVLVLAGFVLDSPGIGSESSLIAAQTARVAARTLADKSPNAGALLGRVNETLWRTTGSGEGVALALALVDAKGVGSYAAAGPAVAIRVRPDGARSVACEETPLGWDLDAEFEAAEVALPPGEQLILAVGDPRLTSPSDERQLADAFRAATGDARTRLTAAAALKRLRTSGSDAIAASTALRRR